MHVMLCRWCICYDACFDLLNEGKILGMAHENQQT